MSKILGCLSEKYESNGNPGAISHSKEDYGNRISSGSYGAYQMLGSTVKNYLTFIQTAYPDIYKVLIKAQIGSTQFDTLWKSLAKTITARFKESQWAFIKKSYYDSIVAKIKVKYGIDINKRSFALMCCIWSTSVQHGVGGALNIFGIALSKSKTDEGLIRAIYAERGRNNGKAHFSKCSANVQKSVVNRFRSELQDTLVLLKEYPIVTPSPTPKLVPKKEVIKVNISDANKIIAVLSAMYDIVTTEQDKNEIHRLANELRKASNQVLK